MSRSSMMRSALPLHDRPAPGAAAPAGGTPEEIARNSEAARGSMEKVRTSLLDMGGSQDRGSISQVTDPAIRSSEVRLYVRGSARDDAAARNQGSDSRIVVWADSKCRGAA
jgi:hypothetical protein